MRNQNPQFRSKIFQQIIRKLINILLQFQQEKRPTTVINQRNTKPTYNLENSKIIQPVAMKKVPFLS
jgi:hypothetical protein